MAPLSLLLDQVVVFLPRLGSALLILIAAFYLIPVGERLVRRLTEGVRSRSALVWLASVAFSAVAWIVAVAAFFSALGFAQIALALTGALSLLALAIGMAAKDTVADFIAGFFLTSDHDFKIGYIIRTGDIEGRIMEIDLRKTRLLSRDTKVHVIPNRQIEATEWIVLERTGLV